MESFQDIEGMYSQNIRKLISISDQLQIMGNGFFSYFLKGKQLKKLYDDLITDFQIPYIDNLKSKKNRDILNGIVALVKRFENKKSEIDWNVL